MEHLISELDAKGAVALVPTRVPTELLMRATESAADLLSRMSSLNVFRVVPFDERAAVECPLMLSAGRRKTRTEGATWAKVRFDHQIVTIAKVRGASRLYSDDRNVKTLGASSGIEVAGVWDLPEPPVYPQQSLPLPAPDSPEKDGSGLNPSPRPRRVLG